MFSIKSLAAMAVCAVLSMGGSVAYAAEAAKPTDAKKETSKPAETKKTAPAKKAAPASKAVESQDVVKQKLDETGKKLVAQASTHIVPNIKQKEVAQATDGRGFVARYLHADPSTLSTELRPSQSGKGYVGIVRYMEYTMECRGESREKALNAPCQSVKSRRMSELLHYDGKWAY